MELFKSIADQWVSAFVAAIGPLGNACANRSFIVPPRGVYQLLVGDRGGFDPSRRTKSPNHSRTSDPTVIKLPKNYCEGAGCILSRMSAANNNKNNKDSSAHVFFHFKSNQIYWSNIAALLGASNHVT